MSINKKRVLVSGASGIVGYGILKSLQKSDYITVGTTIYDDSAAKHFSDYAVKILPTNHEEYIDNLVQIIKEHKIDIIIPSIEVDVLKWAKNKEEIIRRTEIKILLNNKRLIDLCSDKWVFYQELEKHNSIYRIPTYSYSKYNIEFPLIIKPKKGYASKGVFEIRNKEDLEFHRKNINNDIILQPLVGDIDNEYTTSAFFDKESNLCCHITLKRKLSKEGFTEIAQVVDVKDVKNMLIELSYFLKPIGPTNFQFRIVNDQIKLLEINPRISSATSIRSAFGYNESIMSVDYFLDDIKPKMPSIKQGKAVRYVEDIIYYK